MDLVELLNSSLVACRDHDFDLAVVSAWTVCEVVLNMALVDVLTRLHRTDLAVNMERRSSRLKLSAFQAADILALAGVVPNELAQRIKQSRTARNEWIHGAKRATYLTAIDTVQLAAELMDRFVGLSFHVAPTVGVQGLGI